MSLAERVLKKTKLALASLTLVPSTGGVFEVEIDGRLAFSKKKEGRFPEWAEIEPHLAAKAS